MVLLKASKKNQEANQEKPRKINIDFWKYKRIHTSSLQRSPSSKMMQTSNVDSINYKTIEIEFQNREST